MRKRTKLGQFITSEKGITIIVFLSISISLMLFAFFKEWIFHILIDSFAKTAETKTVFAVILFVVLVILIEVIIVFILTLINVIWLLIKRRDR